MLSQSLIANLSSSMTLIKTTRPSDLLVPTDGFSLLTKELFYKAMKQLQKMSGGQQRLSWESFLVQVYLSLAFS
jgi:hypothetical protein